MNDDKIDYLWWMVTYPSGHYKCYELINNRVVLSESKIFGFLFCITPEITSWAKENDIDLANLSEEDENLVVMKWSGFNRFPNLKDV